MMLRFLGALLVLGAGGAVGFSIAAQERREQRQLEDFARSLDMMGQELRCNLTPLDNLLQLAAAQTGGMVANIYHAAAQALQRQAGPDVQACMAAALESCPEAPKQLRELFEHLGRTLGKFDLPGQLAGLRHVHQQCMRRLDALRHGQAERHRSYRILGLCAGGALAILLI